MKFCYYLLLFLSSLPTLLPAQNHDAFGFFGYGVGLTPEFGGATIDYREDPPKIYRGKKRDKLHRFLRLLQRLFW